MINIQTLEKFQKEQVEWKKWCPKRGEVYLVNFGEGLGSEQKSLRPALILSNDMNNKYSTVIQVAPITSANKRRLPVHVKLDKSDNMRTDSICCIEQARSISKERALINGNFVRITMLSDNKMSIIDQAIKIQFGLG